MVQVENDIFLNYVDSTLKYYSKAGLAHKWVTHFLTWEPLLYCTLRCFLKMLFYFQYFAIYEKVNI